MLAILFITNSHFAPLYGPYESLATGGTIGVALFFFCSGFTLFMKPMGGVGNFPNWYKRRILRIYPSVIAFAIVAGIFFDHRWRIDLHRYDGGWFVNCIMVYYLVFFFLGVYFRTKARWLLVVHLLVVAVAFYLHCQDADFYMYKDRFQRIVFFSCMLLGAIMGQAGSKASTRPKADVCLLLLSIVVFYALLFVSIKGTHLIVLQYLSLFVLLVMMYLFYQVFGADWARRCYQSRAGNAIIRVVGGLCLEVYLVQFKLITVQFNHLFPLNLLIIFLEILVVAYLTRCLSRFLLQTFNEAPYDWKKIISVY